MSVESIALWHKRARPEPTDKDFNVQLGCHFEEIVEMMDTLEFDSGEGVASEAFRRLSELALHLKFGVVKAKVSDRKEFLDSLADQIVTATGVGHCAGMNITEACVRVNSSNWSKYDANGQPIFDANGKIAKGPNYHKPALEGLV
jgi:hypothetical protein